MHSGACPGSTRPGCSPRWPCWPGWPGAGRTVGRRLWWTGVAAIGALLALAKLVSAHSSGKGISAVATLVVGIFLTVVALGALAVTGRRWGVPATRPVVLALAIYAAVALGLDAVTSALVAVQDRVGVLSHVAGTFGEELGEALTALYVLVTVRWHLPTDDRSPGVTQGEPALSTRRSPG